MKKKKPMPPASKAKGPKKAGPALKVNKVRHIFTRKKPATSTATTITEDAATEPTTSGGRRNTARENVVKTLKKKAVAVDRKKRSKLQKQPSASDNSGLEDANLSQEKRVYRALKQLHIDFKEVKVVQKLPRRSSIIAKPPVESEQEGPSTDVDPSESSQPSSTPSGKRRNSPVGVTENVSTPDTDLTEKETEKEIPTHSRTGVKRTSRKSDNSLMPAATPDPANVTPVETKVKRSVSKSRQTQQIVDMPKSESVSKSMPKTKSARALGIKSPVSTPELISMMPTSLKRFSTSIYSSRRKIIGTPTQAGDDSGLIDEQSDNTKTEDVSTTDEQPPLYEIVSTSKVDQGRKATRGKGMDKVKRGRGISKIRGRGFAAAAAFSNRGHVQRRYGGRRKKNQIISESLESDAETSKSSDEPPVKKGRLLRKQTEAENDNLDKEKHSAADEEKIITEVEKTSQSKKKTPLLRKNKSLKKNDISKSNTSDMEEQTTTKIPTEKKVGLRKMKVQSRSVESVIRSRRSMPEHTRPVADSRSSSPGLTELRSRHKEVSTTGDLARSSSLDNLLCQTQPSPAVKPSRTKTLSSKSKQLGERAEEKTLVNPCMNIKHDSMLDSLSKPVPFFSSKNFYGSLKRKRTVSPSVKPNEDSHSLSKRALMRLQDSSTHLIPNILMSGRMSRASASNVSPTVSRESSPGTFTKTSSKKMVEETEVVAPTNTDSASLKEEKLGSFQSETKIVKSKSQLSEHQEMKEEKLGSSRSDTKCMKNLSSDPQEQRETLSTSTHSTEPKSSVELLDTGHKETTRRRGRPKGALNKKFKLSHIKRSVLRSESGSGATVVSQFKRIFGRGRGRPKKIPPGQPIELQFVQEPENVQIDGPKHSKTKTVLQETDSTVESEPVMKTKVKSSLVKHRLSWPSKKVSVLKSVSDASSSADLDNSPTPRRKKRKSKFKKVSQIIGTTDTAHCAKESAEDNVLDTANSLTIETAQPTFDSLPEEPVPSHVDYKGTSKTQSTAKQKVRKKNSSGRLKRESSQKTKIPEQTTEQPPEHSQQPMESTSLDVSELESLDQSTGTASIRDQVSDHLYCAKIENHSQVQFNNETCSHSKPPSGEQSQIKPEKDKDSKTDGQLEIQNTASVAEPSDKPPLVKPIAKANSESQSQSDSVNKPQSVKMETDSKENDPSHIASVTEPSDKPPLVKPIAKTNSESQSQSDSVNKPQSVKLETDSKENDPSHTASVAEPSDKPPLVKPIEKTNSESQSRSDSVNKPQTVTMETESKENDSSQCVSESTPSSQTQFETLPLASPESDQSKIESDVAVDPSIPEQSQVFDKGLSDSEPSDTDQTGETEVDKSKSLSETVPDTESLETDKFEAVSADQLDGKTETVQEPPSSGNVEQSHVVTVIEPPICDFSSNTNTGDQSKLDTSKSISSEHQPENNDCDVAESRDISKSQPENDSCNTSVEISKSQQETDTCDTTELKDPSKDQPENNTSDSNLSREKHDPEKDELLDAHSVSQLSPDLQTAGESLVADNLMKEKETEVDSETPSGTPITQLSDNNGSKPEVSIHDQTQISMEQPDDRERNVEDDTLDNSHVSLDMKLESEPQNASEDVSPETNQALENLKTYEAPSGGEQILADASSGAEQSEVSAETENEILSDFQPLTKCETSVAAPESETDSSDMKIDSVSASAKQVPSDVSDVQPQQVCESLKTAITDDLATVIDKTNVLDTATTKSDVSATAVDKSDVLPNSTYKSDFCSSSQSLNLKTDLLEGVYQPTFKAQERTDICDSSNVSNQNISYTDHQCTSKTKSTVTSEHERLYEPIAERKHKAISRELKRLQTDEGAQRIMSWHEKKKLKSLGKLLRSKIKDDKHEEGEKQKSKLQKPKRRLNRLYSIDAISDTRLVFKTGKSINSAPREQGGKSELTDQGESRSRSKHVFSASSSIDSEDGPPPNITEMAPYKDSRSERGRSEELSPPPLIRPEDLFSEEYYVSMPGTPLRLNYDRRSISPEKAAGDDHVLHKRDDVLIPGIDAPHGKEASGPLPPFASGKPGPVGKKKRGRHKRRYSKIGPASKTGRELHIKPGPASSKPGSRKNASAMNLDPPFVHNMPQLQSTPRTFALRPKTTRSPIEIIAMRQKLEEEAYELEEATRIARKLKRKQALFNKLATTSDSDTQKTEGECKPCSVVLVDFVKELHLNSIDTSDQYISDVSYDSEEGELDEEDEEDYADEYYVCRPEDDALENRDIPHLSIHRKTATHQSDQKASDNSQLLTVDTAQAVNLSQPGTSSTVSSAPSPNKSVPDLESLRGKGFMGNFVDFIENRNKDSFTPMFKARPRPVLKTPRFDRTSSSITCTATDGLVASSDSTVNAPPLTSVAVSSVLSSVSSQSPVVITAQMHTSPQNQGWKAVDDPECSKNQTVSSSPSMVAESKQITAEKNQYHQHSAIVKSYPEKGTSPGKLKVFPAKKENDGISEKSVFTRYLCTKCDFSATNKGTIESHIYRHIPGVTFKCGYCDSEFTGLISALTHVKNSHSSKEPKVWISKDINEASLYTEEEVGVCQEQSVTSLQSCEAGAGSAEPGDVSPVCDKPVAQEPAQPVIISLVVSGDRPVQRQERFSSSPLATQRRFACTHCSYSTNIMEDAHQHVRDLHSANSLYTCYLCDKAFGCSQQEIVAHCETTHPDRPKSFKKLPDFYDHELLRNSISSSDRGKATDDRGNIFDRMSNLFPNLGPGSEGMDDGQLSPQARFLRARDYLYIQEGWSMKTSAEADSTTIEDIEIPFEETSDACGLDSTSDEHMTDQQSGCMDEGAHAVSSGPADLSVSSKTNTDTLSSQAGAKGSPSDTESYQSKDIEDQKTDTRTDPFSSHENRSDADYNNEQNNHTLVKEVSETSTFSSENLQSKPDISELTEQSQHSKISQSGDQVEEMSEKEATKPCETESENVSAEDDLCPDAEIRNQTDGEARTILATESTQAAYTLDGKLASELPVSPDSDGDGEEDGADILVIDLNEDIMEDGADDTSPASTPIDEAANSSFTKTGADKANVGEPASQNTQVMDSPVETASHLERTGPEHSQTHTSHHEETTASFAEEDGSGIKILSVVSLSNRKDSDMSHPSGKSQESKSNQLSPTQKTPITSKPMSSSSSGRKSTTPTEQLPVVDADDIATRNERIVCTYKCHSCSVHSPALSAIVEHLKQHHHNVPLFSCPYCRLKKDSFFTEEKVHLHVSENHPTNYAKNEVSLSEIAKSFVQVLALPSGKRSKGTLVEQDIYMCLECSSHLPDQDYAFRHLKLEHPGMLKYACPVCGTYAHASQEMVKHHLLVVHGQPSQSVQLSLAMDGVYLNKVVSISLNGQYVDHASPTPTKVTSTGASTSTSVNSAVASTSKGHSESSSVTASSSVPVIRSLYDAAAVSGQSQLLASTGLSDTAKTKHRARHKSKLLTKPGASQSPRPILPMPGAAHSPRTGSESFQATGLTVKNILGTRHHSQDTMLALQETGMSVKDIIDLKQRSSEAATNTSSTVNTDISSAALSLTVPDVSGSGEQLSPRGMFSMTERLSRLGHGHHSPHGASPSSASSKSPVSPSRPVLRVPNVSSVLDLTSSNRSSSMSVDTGTSCNTLMTGASLPSSASSHPSRSGSSLPFTTASLTSPVSSVPPLGSNVIFSVPKSPLDREDPEAFKIFNLKPRTPVPQSPQPSVSPVVTTKSSPSVPPSASPRLTQPSNVVPGAVTVASSALFPQQFRLQQFPQVQPASIATLPLGQGGLPLAQNFALPIGVSLPLAPGISNPFNVAHPQLFMAQNSFPPVLVPANLLPQLGMRPQLPVVSGSAPPPPPPPPAHQSPASDPQAAPVNLSLSQSRPASAGAQLTAKTSKPSTQSPASFQPKVGPFRGRGRPRLDRNPAPSLLTPVNPGSPALRPAFVPTSLPQQNLASPPSSASSSSRQSDLSPSKSQRHGASHHCVCPYCPQGVILKPWEVAQHIKMSHPGKEVKYNRV